VTTTIQVADKRAEVDETTTMVVASRAMVAAVMTMAMVVVDNTKAVVVARMTGTVAVVNMIVLAVDEMMMAMAEATRVAARMVAGTLGIMNVSATTKARLAADSTVEETTTMMKSSSRPRDMTLAATVICSHRLCPSSSRVAAETTISMRTG
jgi:hypothetical protein